MSTTIEVQVENIKCGGCENSIVRGLKQIEGTGEVSVDRQQQIVRVEADDALRAQIVQKLLGMGYPEVGSVHGLGAGLTTAKSFVSCAIGRMR